MELLIELVIGVLVFALLVVGLAVWRISRAVSWQALAMMARATGSLVDCVAFIRFCAEEETELGGIRQIK